MTRSRGTNLLLAGMLATLLLLGFAVTWLALSNSHLADQANGLRRQVASIQSARDASLADLRGQITDLQTQVAALSADNERLAQMVRDLGGDPEVVVVHPDATPSRHASPAPRPRRPSASPTPTPSHSRTPSPSPRCPLICLP